MTSGFVIEMSDYFYVSYSVAYSLVFVTITSVAVNIWTLLKSSHAPGAFIGQAQVSQPSRKRQQRHYQLQPGQWSSDATFGLERRAILNQVCPCSGIQLLNSNIRESVVALRKPFFSLRQAGRLHIPRACRLQNFSHNGKRQGCARISQRLPPSRLSHHSQDCWKCHVAGLPIPWMDVQLGRAAHQSPPI